MTQISIEDAIEILEMEGYDVGTYPEGIMLEVPDVFTPKELYELYLGMVEKYGEAEEPTIRDYYDICAYIEADGVWRCGLVKEAKIVGERKKCVRYTVRELITNTMFDVYDCQDIILTEGEFIDRITRGDEKALKMIERWDYGRIEEWWEISENYYNAKLYYMIMRSERFPFKEYISLFWDKRIDFPRRLYIQVGGNIWHLNRNHSEDSIHAPLKSVVLEKFGCSLASSYTKEKVFRGNIYTPEKMLEWSLEFIAYKYEEFLRYVEGAKTGYIPKEIFEKKYKKCFDRLGIDIVVLD